MHHSPVQLGAFSTVLALVICFLFAHPASSQRQAANDWGPIWDEVEGWGDTPEIDNRVQVRKVRKLAIGRGDSLRSALLGALIGRNGSEAVSTGHSLELELLILPPENEWSLNARETWLAARVLPAGETRTKSLVQAMRISPSAWSSDQINFIYKAGVEAAEDLRLEEAIAIQQPLHDRALAEWSGFNLALSLRRMGLYQRADGVLAGMLEVGPNAELYSQRGLNALGSRNEKRARTYLGTALAQGSVDAAVILARLDLAAGRLKAARAGFRAILVGNPDNAWALRGWGISQLKPLRAASRD